MKLFLFASFFPPHLVMTRISHFNATICTVQPHSTVLIAVISSRLN